MDQLVRRNGRTSKTIAAQNAAKPKAKLLGRYIIADPDICHGKPTFRGTRIMVWQVLNMVAKGMSWEEIAQQWDNRINHAAIAEAVALASKTFVAHSHEFLPRPIPA